MLQLAWLIESAMRVPVVNLANIWRSSVHRAEANG